MRHLQCQLTNKIWPFSAFLMDNGFFSVGIETQVFRMERQQPFFPSKMIPRRGLAPHQLLLNSCKKIVILWPYPKSLQKRSLLTLESFFMSLLVGPPWQDDQFLTNDKTWNKKRRSGRRRRNVEESCGLDRPTPPAPRPSP